MRRAGWPTWSIVGAVLLALAGLAAAWTFDRSSIERGNRLYRGQAFREAAKIYANQLARQPRSAAIRYNLGTALLGLGNPAAGEALAAVGEGAEIEVRLRALNNLGLWRIAEAAKAFGQKRARGHALAAVAAYREALRLRPGHADASWNLAIALRMLASINAGDYGEASEPTAPGGERDGDALLEGDQSGAGKEQEQDPVPGPTTGEGETAAPAGAAAPLSQGEADRLLGTSHRDPTAMVGKLIALEGRLMRQRSFGKSDPR